MASAIQSQMSATSTSSSAVIKNREENKKVRRVVNAIAALMIAIGAIILAVGITFMCLQSVTAGIPLVAVGGSTILIGLVALAVQQIKSAHDGTRVARRKDKIAGLKIVTGYVKDNVDKKRFELTNSNTILQRIKSDRNSLEHTQVSHNLELSKKQEAIAQKEGLHCRMDKEVAELQLAAKQENGNNGLHAQKLAQHKKEMKSLKAEIKSMKKARDKMIKSNLPLQLKNENVGKEEEKWQKQVNMLEEELTQLELFMKDLPSQTTTAPVTTVGQYKYNQAFVKEAKMPQVHAYARLQQQVNDLSATVGQMKSSVR
ncbi:hypothetical protein CLAVI_000433 [Candidatus Clavichlamydia salmonicola]|uniref:hypothetical protein n=1 Tax=Candidatus Clavichlamydia salmonicola TaxID=469812 RepID=UPI001891D18B|nr:hypothetical protein [Candidatus Clavichlamydia salmonicola]MBF5050814.1 hypothetical protein [Candidatus Clavichlamydia salmonicola]